MEKEFAKSPGETILIQCPPLAGFTVDESQRVLDEVLRRRGRRGIPAVVDAMASIHARELRLQAALQRVAQDKGIRRVVYPGSGSHTSLRDALGEDRVVHVDDDSCHHDHLADLGFGMRVMADAARAPFASGSFDAGYARGITAAATDTHQVFEELRRVVSTAGLIMIDPDDQSPLTKYCKQALVRYHDGQPVQHPDHDVLTLYRNQRRVGFMEQYLPRLFQKS